MSTKLQKNEIKTEWKLKETEGSKDHRNKTKNFFVAIPKIPMSTKWRLPNDIS